MYTPFYWQPPAGPIQLSHRDVHVWRVFLDAPAAQTPEAMRQSEACLSLSELIKANRFYFPKDRERYITAHAALRCVLAEYLKIEPRQIEFVTNPYGKPMLSNHSRDTLEFNLSHSNSMALIAVSRSRAVGVDIEYMRSDLASLQIAEKFFSRREVEVLRALMLDVREEAFFNCWTRKEAYLKARGRGLSLALDQFDVSMLPGEPVILLNVYGNAEETQRWRLRELLPGAGYAASLAVEGHDWDLKCWQWREKAAPAQVDRSAGVTFADPERSIL